MVVLYWELCRLALVAASWDRSAVGPGQWEQAGEGLRAAIIPWLDLASCLLLVVEQLVSLQTLMGGPSLS